MIQELEKYLQDKVFPDLEKGRPNWDRTHTERVVKFTKEIIKDCADQNVDFFVLLIAAYCHDWGYAGLFDSDYATYQEIKNQKDLHMEIGAVKTAKILKDSIFDFLTPEEKERIVHLVFMHDRLAEIHDLDEIILAEADTLGALENNVENGTFDLKDNEKYLEKVKIKRLPIFIHSKFKAKAEELVEKSRVRFKYKII